MKRLMLLALPLLLVSGCGTVADRTAAVSGRAMGSVGETLDPVKVEKLDEQGVKWLLSQQYDEPPVLDGFQMDYRARGLCPEGYLKDEVYALAPRKLAADNAACVSADCRYTLVWKIHCEEVPQAPFSIFGKF